MDSILIKLNNKEWVIKQSFRSYLYYEEMTGKQVGDVQTIKDILTLLFCTFRGCNKDWNYTWDEFLDFIDENPEILTKYNEFNTSLLSPTTEKKSQEKE